MSWREILLWNIVKQTFKNEHFLKLTLQALVEPIELVRMTNVSRLSWNPIWDKSQNKYIAQYLLAKAACNIDKNHQTYIIVINNIIAARMELDIIVALSWTWVETKQQIGRNWPWPLQAEFTGSPTLIFVSRHVRWKWKWSLLWGIFCEKLTVRFSDWHSLISCFPLHITALL